MNDFYVYEWIRQDTMEPFYIGKGKGDRCYRQYRNPHFNNIVNKVDCVVNILEDNLTEEEAFQYECWYIHEYKYEIGYNMANITDGGEGGTPSNETRKKLSEKLKGRKLTLEHREKISKVVRGRKYSKEFGEKVSENLTGHIVTQETREKISKKCKGYKHTEEAKQKISDAVKNRDKQIIDKVANSNTGKKRSDESRKRMSEAAKKRKPMSEETKLKISNTLKNKNK